MYQSFFILKIMPSPLPAHGSDFGGPENLHVSKTMFSCVHTEFFFK